MSDERDDACPRGCGNLGAVVDVLSTGLWCPPHKRLGIHHHHDVNLVVREYVCRRCSTEWTVYTRRQCPVTHCEWNERCLYDD